MPRNESLTDVCTALNIAIETERDGNRSTPDDFKDAIGWRVVLRKGRRQFSVDFFQGRAHTKPPTAADVLNCLCSDARAGEETFENFCSDFGYDPDSRKAERIWKACKSIAPRLRRFLGDDFDRCANAEH